MKESSVVRIGRVNNLKLIPFIEWVLKTPIKGEAVSNAIWHALAQYIKNDLKNEYEYTRYCTSYVWSVSATGEVDDPEIAIVFTCPNTRSLYVYPDRFQGKLIICKKHYSKDIDYDSIIALDNEENPKYVITVEYTP